MADEWIKLRTKLPRDGRLRIASRTCHALPVTVLGALVTLWCLADELADADGSLPGYTEADVDAHVGVPGFCRSLPSDWIDLSGPFVKLPDYQEHNGTTGKSRSQAAKRQQRRRSVTPLSRSDRDTSVTREEGEKKRVEAVGSFEDGTDVTQDADRAAALAALGTRNGRASRELRAAGLTDCTPSRPELSAALDQGITVEELVEVARECVPKGKTGIAYIVKAAIGRRADAAAIVVPNKPATAGPVAGYSPPAVSTAETKWRDEIAVARQNVGYGVWTQEQADARLAERAAALGFEWPEKPAGQPSTATEPPNA